MSKQISGTTGKSNGYTFFAILYDEPLTNGLNYSIVTYEVYLKNGIHRTNSSYWTFNAKIDGENVYNETNKNLNTTDVDYYENHLVFSGFKLVPHNDDGSKTITFSAKLSKSSYSNLDPGECNLSGTFKLADIPRASIPTIGSQSINKPDFNLGDTITIYTNRKSTTFKHKLFFNYDNSSLLVGQNITDSIQFATSLIKDDIYQLIPNAQYYSNTFTLETYDDNNNLVGTKTCTYKANVVNSKPIFLVAYEDSNEDTVDVTEDNQKIIQNVSTLQFNIENSEALNYATLSTISVSINGVTKTESISNLNPDENGNFSFIYGTLNLSNNIEASVTIKDSRNFETTKKLTIVILEWELPTAIISLNRKSNYYTETDLNVDANYSSLNGKNEIDIKYRIKKVSDANYGTYQALQDNVGTTFNADNLYAWDIQIVLEDKIGRTIYNKTIGIGIPIIFIDRLLRSFSINTFPSHQNSFEINGSLYISDENGNNAKEIRDLIYPVGSIYLSVNNVNPSTLFGGTWIAFGTGRTLVGVDTSQTEFDTVEKTGGEKTHTLTINEMPSHTHTDGTDATNGIYAPSGQTSAIVYYNQLSGRETSSTGGNQPHNILQPYITVYMWKRTA